MEAVRGVATSAADQPAAKIRKAGAQFEAVLLNNVLGAVERAFTELPGGHREFSADAFNGLALQTLTATMADRGGIGIGRFLSAALAQRSSDKAHK